ncbi:MAG: hypothetical protein A2580_17915 [Hydrogenophilales bacterium RIFOXYD1_FULL_62_11]|nr:MAG: hypothetical protein A2580_17915 [Hydrogenophilales bacterium RIFOXYD1_FULL_62_11]
MTLDLFPSADLDTNQTGETSSATPARPAVNMPPEVLELDALYFAEFTLHQETSRKVRELKGRLQCLPGMKYESLDLLNGVSDSADIRKLVDGYATRIGQVAEARLSLPHAPFNHEQFRVMSDTRERIQDYHQDTCDLETREENEKALLDFITSMRPLTVWDEYVKHFNPENQLLLQARRHAAVVNNYFSTYRGDPQPMKIVRGCVELIVNVYCQKRFHGGREYDGSWMRALGPALDTAMEMTRDGGEVLCFGDQLESLGNQFQRGRAVNSRERIDLGDGASVVVGFEAFKLYLPQAIAARANLFVAEHLQAED